MSNQSDKFLFYSKSADKKPGQGSNEHVNNIADYHALSQIKDWRKMLSNFYVSEFVLDDELWASLEHFFHAAKFRNNKKESVNYDYYKTFTATSTSPWAVDPVLAKSAGKAGRISKTTGKIFTKTINGIPIPKNVKIRGDFYNGIDKKVLIIGFLAKFTQNPILTEMLLNTGDAELWHYVGRGAPNQHWIELEKVRECIRKYQEYDLQKITKFSSTIVSDIINDS